MALCMPGAALAVSEGWTEDFEAAKKEAAEQEKDLLINFTGSDWCGWCIKLKEEVFSQDAFDEGVKEDFVLVELDYPQDDSKLSPETIEQNKQLAEKYAVQGYPTILLTNADGRPYAATGYQPGGPEAYVEHLGELQAKKATLEKSLEAARESEGVEKAKALMIFLESTGLNDPLIDNFYADVTAEIKAADPEDETGFAKQQAARKRMADLEQGLQQAAGEGGIEGALEFINKALEDEDLGPEEAQQITATKAMIQARMGDFDEALETVDKAKALAPESEVAGQLDGLKQQLEMAKDQANGQAGEEEEEEE